MSKIGFEFPAQHFEGCGFANAIGSDEAEDLTGTGHGQAVEFEGVGSVAVGGVAVEVFGQIDDLDGFKGTLFHADTASCNKIMPCP